MKCIYNTALFKGFSFIFIIILFTSGTSKASEIKLEPENATVANGNTIRIDIYADDAVNLISMGVRLSFDPAILQVVEAYKNEDAANGWVMDADGDPATTSDRHTGPAVEIDNINGSVAIIGGRLSGTTPSGLSGKILLGWVIFQGETNGTSSLSVDHARYHPNHPADTFDNFVDRDGMVVVPTNLPGDLGSICIGTDACVSPINNCLADLNDDGFVNFADLAQLRANFGTDCTLFPPDQTCIGDTNGDRFVNYADLAQMRSEFGRTDCLEAQ